MKKRKRSNESIFFQGWLPFSKKITRYFIAPKFFLSLLFLLLSICYGYTQKKNSFDAAKTLKQRFHASKTQKFLSSFIRKSDTVFVVKSEDPYVAYEGKIIRKIRFKHLGFERNVIDSSRKVLSFIAETGNRLHSNSKLSVVRDNLFIREGQPLNSYRVADNERYLRNLDFILDSRIYVKPIATTKDSVDLLVVTRDVFSFGGSFSPDSPTKYKIQVEELNLAGLGQRLQFTTLVDAARNPRLGFGLLYQKTNIAGSFVNGVVDYSQIGTDRNYGTENQRSYSVQLTRQLFMPYTRWAGGITLSVNKSDNVYSKPDSVFENYHYNLQDYWVGYSFGSKRKMEDIKENRNRRFVALRGFQQYYSQVPTRYANRFDSLYYHNRTSVLGQIIFFRQDFYKTRYVLGFGRTEDVPYGYRITFTGGWEQEQDLQRPYVGAEIYRNVVNRNGAFFIYTLRLASYYAAGRSEDALASVNLTHYSKIYAVQKSFIRQQWDLGYAKQLNQIKKRPLNINDINGLTGFLPDSLFGNERFNLRYEITLFTRWNLIGFRIAPTARAEVALLSPAKTRLILEKNIYSSISGGFRIRNENLIFNTIEARISFYPRTVERISQVGFSIQVNFKIKYPTTLISEPATVYN